MSRCLGTTNSGIFSIMSAVETRVSIFPSCWRDARARHARQVLRDSIKSRRHFIETISPSQRGITTSVNSSSKENRLILDIDSAKFYCTLGFLKSTPHRQIRRNFENIGCGEKFVK